GSTTEWFSRPSHSTTLPLLHVDSTTLIGNLLHRALRILRMRHGQSVVSVNLQSFRQSVGRYAGWSLWTQRDCVHKGSGFRWPQQCLRTMASPSALGA